MGGVDGGGSGGEGGVGGGREGGKKEGSENEGSIGEFWMHVRKEGGREGGRGVVFFRVVVDNTHVSCPPYRGKKTLIS